MSPNLPHKTEFVAIQTSSTAVFLELWYLSNLCNCPRP